jgi:hypothetical protein
MADQRPRDSRHADAVHCPGEIDPHPRVGGKQPERAAEPDELSEIIGADLVAEERLQRRQGADDNERLRQAIIASTEETDVAIAPGLRRGPGDAAFVVVDILGVKEDLGLASGAPHTAPRDDDLGISPIGEHRRAADPVTAFRGPGSMELATISSELHDRGIPPRRPWHVNVSRQRDPTIDRNAPISQQPTAEIVPGRQLPPGELLRAKAGNLQRDQVVEPGGRQWTTTPRR